MQRVREITLHNVTWYEINESSSAFGLSFLDRNICPDLQVIKRHARIPSFEATRHRTLGIEGELLRYIAQTLPMPAASSTLDETLKINPSKLRDMIITGQQDYLSRHYWGPTEPQSNRDLVKALDLFIKSRDLVMETSYNFTVEAFDFEENLLPCTLPFWKRHAQVTVIWDKNGLKAGELPDFISMMPWETVPEKTHHSIMHRPRHINIIFSDFPDNMADDEYNNHLFRVSW